MTIDKARRAIDLGNRAKALLSNEMLLASFEALKQKYVQMWMQSSGSKPEDVLTREDLWRKAKVVDEVKKNLETLLANGNNAQRNLET